MDKKVKDKWVKALKSKKYKKGIARLKKGNCYCVMGVLCAVIGLDSNDKDEFIYQDKTYRTFPPEELCKNLGITKSGHLPKNVAIKGKKLNLLSYINDVSGATFEDMADIIESYL
jgi:hypothetical protein